MRYFVIAPDGQKYGPADLNTLNQWVREGRVTQQMMLEGEDGLRMVAGSVVGLMFPGAPTNYSQPPDGNVYAGNPYTTPGTTSSYSAPTAYDGYYNRGYTGGPMPFDPNAFPKFNWGAFLMGWIWGLNHKKPITLIEIPVSFVLSGLGGLGFRIWFGIVGYQWAWESGRFATYEECRKCQAVWGWWGLGLTVVGCAVGLFFGIAAAAFSGF